MTQGAYLILSLCAKAAILDHFYYNHCKMFKIGRLRHFLKLLSVLEQSISLVVLDFTKTNEVMIRIVFVLVLRFEVDP